ncbi:GNAT domain-containing protein [Pleurostoma richardsiae]|uniref:GNAT domain-containing protein n=1 Tax=Pleurostoma richardsiae TaxID=41990 RepID=A0AA38VEA1_9PEZI|nr:GNAT domain-containing protein [Pleurostoma richardsiae]
MKFNEHTAVSTSRVLLVPYDRHHVRKYHQWMQDPAIQEATASEPLTLEEEYENQESWRESRDKLTFIVCQPVAGGAARPVVAGQVDAPERMVGDINFFLHPWDEEDPDEDGHTAAATEADRGRGVTLCAGEVDIMIADHSHRGRGVGRAAVSAFLRYIRSNLTAILEEYASDKDVRQAKLRLLMAKIKESNAGSIALFKSLGFVQKGDVNYFGEVTMVLEDLERISSMPAEDYEEVGYTRLMN